MKLQHIALKVFVDGELSVDWEQFINVFHQWVAEQSMPEMMIDVADYRHVPDGPGVILVGHEADYYLDNTDGKPGLRYVCKKTQELDNAAQLKLALDHATRACSRLEQAIAGLKFSRNSFELTINDRGIAPNNPATQSELTNILPGIWERAVGTAASVEIQSDPRKLAGGLVRTSDNVEFADAIS